MNAQTFGLDHCSDLIFPVLARPEILGIPPHRNPDSLKYFLEPVDSFLSSRTYEMNACR